MSDIDEGPCQAVDMLPTEDDAIAVECGRPGRRVHETDAFGHARTRIACRLHALEYDDVN
jgi:hypothetical protein